MSKNNAERQRVYNAKTTRVEVVFNPDTEGDQDLLSLLDELKDELGLRSRAEAIKAILRSPH